MPDLEDEVCNGVEFTQAQLRSAISDSGKSGFDRRVIEIAVTANKTDPERLIGLHLLFRFQYKLDGRDQRILVRTRKCPAGGQQAVAVLASSKVRAMNRL